MKKANTDQMIADIFRLCSQLSQGLGRPISPDGHLVGGLGEVFARERLRLTLESASTKDFDARDSEGRKVQIKTTTRSSIALSGKTPGVAERLVVVQLDPADGSGSIVYEGPAAPIWAMAPKPLKRRQWSKSVRIIAGLTQNELNSEARNHG